MPKNHKKGTVFPMLTHEGIRGWNMVTKEFVDDESDKVEFYIEFDVITKNGIETRRINHFGYNYNNKAGTEK